jgi:hypothetical protein
LKLGVKRVILTKFHKVLKTLTILNNFQMESAAISLIWILIQIGIRIWRSFNTESCSLIQILQLHILFEILEFGKASFGPNQTQYIFERIQIQIFWTGPTVVGPHSPA